MSLYLLDSKGLCTLNSGLNTLTGLYIYIYLEAFYENSWCQLKCPKSGKTYIMTVTEIQDVQILYELKMYSLRCIGYMCW